MVKRSATDADIADNSPSTKTKDGQRENMDNNPIDPEYEDPWEDEIESDEEEKQDDEAMDVDSDVALEEVQEEEEEDRNERERQPFILGVDELPEGHVLEADDSLYIMRHDLLLDWPCLSFDILHDDLGDERQRLPATAYIITGTQTARSQDNMVRVAKLTSLHRTQTYEDSDDEDEDEDALDEDPIVEQCSIPHLGTVNRVRVQRLSSPALPSVSQPYHAASFSDTGKVHIYNIRPLIESLDVPGYALDHKDTMALAQAPLFTVDSHNTEGYAMDWNAPSASSVGLLTGDNDSKIYLTTAANANFRPSPTPFQSHDASVEDIQWSPTEITVFSSCSVDKSIRIWDIRSKGRQSVASILDAHNSDVNVISWNRLTSYLLLSGGDDGVVKVWDLRNIKQSQSQVARFDWHRGPINSVEWHPTDDSVFAASGEDNQVTLWDLALEQDDDAVMSSGHDNTGGVPPQLLFTHYQDQVKDVHWHHQITGTLISSGSSLNVFKPINT